MSERVFGFTVSYRPVAPELVGSEPDERPVDRLPSVSGPGHASEAEREADLQREVSQLEAGGYRVERIERWNSCAACQGSGRVSARPARARRHRHDMTTKACPACRGGGAEHIVESMMTLVQAEAR